MFASFDRLQEDLALLRAYAEFLAEAAALSRLQIPRRLRFAEHIRPLQTARMPLASAALSELTYSSLIIALYGAIERFGEASLADYVKYLNSICLQYEELPTSLRQAHLDATWKVLQAPESASRYGTPTEFVADLHSCLQGDEDYRLTATTFTYHTANFRHGIFQELWARLGVADMASAIQDDKAYREMVDEVDPGESTSSFFRFDDIAERRNEVAHGATPTELISSELFLQYVNIVEAFASAMKERVRSAALGEVAQRHGVHYGTPLKVFNQAIVGLRCGSGRIEVGDLLVAGLPDGSYRGGQILEMEVDGTAMESVDGDAASVDVGLRVEFRAKMNQRFAVVPSVGPIGEAWRGVIEHTTAV